MKSKDKNTTKRMETSKTSPSSTGIKRSTTIDTLKRFWRQNWHRIASAFAVLVVVCSIAFSCGVNASALEITPDDYRYIDVNIRQIDHSESIEVNYNLAPPVNPSPDMHYIYPRVNWYYYQEGLPLDSDGFYTYDGEVASSSVGHLVYVEENGELSYSPTYTVFELNEFSVLPSVIASGQSIETLAVSDPYNFINFSSDAICTADIKLVIARSENAGGAFSYKEVYYTDAEYYLAQDTSFYNYLVRNITASNFTYYPDGVTTSYRPSEGDFISSVSITTYDSDFHMIGAPVPQYAETQVTQTAYYASNLNLAAVMAVLRLSGGLSDYEAGYNDGKNAGLTESLGIVDWLVKAGDAVMNFQLFRVADTSVTIGSIFTVIVGSLLIVFILKVFAGG